MQMEFLVPHTNFNEDSYPITLKTREPDVVTEDNIGDYIEIAISEQTQIGKRGNTLSARISQIIDSVTVVVLGDTELTSEFFNRKVTLRGSGFKSATFVASRVYPNDDEIDDSFTGATVLPPSPGMYTDNIAVLDFASLYPTIMISRNLCYSTFLMDDAYRDIPGVKYERIAWDDKVEYRLRHTCEAVGKSGKSKGQVCGKQAFFDVEGHYFCRIHDPMKKTRSGDEKYQKRDVTYDYTVVQPHVDETGKVINEGVLPALLKELYSERKRVKREMAKAQEAGNKTLAEILDSTQLAIKVSLNSTYGFLGRCQGNLILKQLGSIVTSVGRMLIEQTKEYSEGPFINYIRENGLLTHKLGNKTYKLNKDEEQKLLARFSCQ